MKTLKDLLLHELAAIHGAEMQFARGLPVIAGAAVAERLQRILHKHGKETTAHVTKLESVYAHFGANPAPGQGVTATGMVDEAQAIASAFQGSPALDAALIGTVQKIEHYEIAAYGCLHEWAEMLGNEPATRVLGEILEDEKTANEALTQLARARCNELARGADTAA